MSDTPTPPASTPENPFATHYCDICGEPDWVDVDEGGKIRQFFKREDSTLVCEVCNREAIREKLS